MATYIVVYIGKRPMKTLVLRMRTKIKFVKSIEKNIKKEPRKSSVEK